MRIGSKLCALVCVIISFALLLCGCGVTPRIAARPDSTQDPAAMVTGTPDGDADATPEGTGDNNIEETPDAAASETPLESEVPTNTPEASASIMPTDSPSNSVTPDSSTPTPKPTATPTPKPTATPTPEPQEADIIAFSTSAINGGSYSNSMFSNAPLTMINVWATWCGPCIEELPHIQQLSKTYAGRVQVVTILYDSSDDGAVESAQLTMNSIGFTVPVLRCNSSVKKAFIKPYNVTALPFTFFIDSNGNVVSTERNSHTYDQWCSIINNLL